MGGWGHLDISVEYLDRRVAELKPISTSRPTYVVEIIGHKKRLEALALNNKTVLIADDDEQIREVLELYLIREGFAVIGASDGLETVNKSLSDNPDIILLDIMLPVIDGFEVFRRIRAFSSVPIIFISALAQEADRRLGLELGAEDFISKPFSPREISKKVAVITRRDVRI